MPERAYGEGFVERVVEACDGVERALAPDAPADAVAASLCEELFVGVLGYDAAAIERDGAVARLAPRSGGDPRVLLATVGRDEEVSAVVETAITEAAATPSARYVVAGGLDRLVVFERAEDETPERSEALAGRRDASDVGGYPADEPDGAEGVTTSVLTDVPVLEVVDAGRRGRLSGTLRPDKQIAIARLAKLEPAAVSPDATDEPATGTGGSAPGPAGSGGESDAAPDTGSAGAGGTEAGAAEAGGAGTGRTEGRKPATGEPAAGSAEARSATAGAPDAVGPEVGATGLAAILAGQASEVLLPAVEEAFADVSDDLPGYDEREAALAGAVDERLRGPGDDTTAAAARGRLLDYQRAHAAARELRVAYGTWVRGTGRTGYTPSENHRAFVRVATFALLDEVFVLEVATEAGLCPAGLSDGAGERFEAAAADLGVERDAGDRLQIAREAFADAYDRAAPDLAGWALEHPAVAAAVDDVAATLGEATFVDPAAAAATYDDLLAAVDPPTLAVDLDDPLPDVALDAAGYAPDAAIEAPESDLLDPAVGDGRFLLAAAARIRERLADAPPARRIETARARLVGASPDPLACRVAETRLFLALLDDYRAARANDGSFRLATLQVCRTDPLVRPDEQTTLDAPYAGAPDPLDRADFAYVVGRFPARLRRDVADGPAAEAYAEYDAAHYTYDTSALYVERAADWLAENGALAAVVAGRFRDTRFGTKLRERLPQWYRLEELREVPGEAAGRTPVLLVARRFRKNEPLVSPAEFDPPRYAFRYAEGLDAPSRSVPSARLTGEEWTFEAPSEGEPETDEGAAD